MSTFDGKITEIPQISVDRFDGENINSTIYFLSHCHTDHMRGLKDWAFHQALIHRPGVFLYASPISVKILKGWEPNIESKLKELPLDNPTLIKFPYRDDKTLTVTPLPAGHCPGSVMFLFETDKTVLYTGDYRVSANDLKKYKAFYSLGELKKIHKLYLDTTFFKKSFLTWPLRQDSLEHICKIIKEWTEKSEKHVIKIALSATYGSEYLFIEIAKTLCMPIHVSVDNYNKVYKYIPEMDEAVTTNSRKTQIHAACGSGLKHICIKDNNLIRVVIPSALWWEGNDFSAGITAVTKKEEYRVCYSCHASFEEITEFLLFLKPMEIEPCVVPTYDKEKKKMFALLEETIQMYKDPPKEDVTVKLFSVNEDGPTNSTSEMVQAELSTPEKVPDNLLEDILASPPKNFKRKRLWLNENQENNLTSKKQ